MNGCMIKRDKVRWEENINEKKIKNALETHLRKMCVCVIEMKNDTNKTVLASMIELRAPQLLHGVYAFFLCLSSTLNGIFF